MSAAIGKALQVQAQSDESPVVLTEASGFHRAISDEEMVGIYRSISPTHPCPCPAPHHHAVWPPTFRVSIIRGVANRENQNVDWVPWAGRKYNVRQLYKLVDTLIKGRPQKYLSLVVVKDNRITFLPLAARPMTLTMNRMKAIVQGLRNGTRAGLQFPNTVFLMNVWDEGRCHRDEPANASASIGAPATSTTSSSSDPAFRAKAPRCTVPVFSLIKSWDYETGSSNETDVLLPFFNHVYGNLVFYPWEKKAQMRPNCTRLWIIELQRSNPEGRRLLDAGITNNLSKRKDIKLVDFVPIPDHARYRYLLSADGFTASCRLGKLLGTNSVVLKETTPWIEYYYRSLKPEVHFVPFNKDNVLEVVKDLEADPGRCQRISAEAQQFAYTFLSQHSKAMYVKRALVYYNSLLPDMEPFVEQLTWPAEGEAGGGGGPEEGGVGGLTLVGLMEQMRAFVGARRRRGRM
ncbi:hypothetical protein VOLCADRAFT_94091 [Volvox carteri f. nagariensis]|uniref:Glycosyl transferase CAP10 domain-containing protein n=1 Tax=Volvox carteri f. nagariensis TaxID=3068 RepID=D8U3W3_VOLCA|nr:uncharacterized protein VOLCADRAFT_94091 [Volvox carteri f. nagariensis]EFJ45679.1 hypothetical protein VOLCADRAFT_94091 [Volvox carteri f. nagariensis]|eukprot:XP_002953369.1 hypothetical protein VOLCADRAFT_94091 [Volvox carteri f. nagariensis]